MRPWEAAELGAFLDHAASPSRKPVRTDRPGWSTAGEACGLRWSDVDVTQGVIVVRQQLVQLDGQSYDRSACRKQHRGIRFGPPKTSSGDARRVDLGQRGTGTLFTERLVQDAERAAWRDAYVDRDLVCSSNPNLVNTSPDVVAEPVDVREQVGLDVAAIAGERGEGVPDWCCRTRTRPSCGA